MDASERWQILRLHVEDEIPLATLARETGVGLRTLERWHHRYKSDGTLTPPASAASATRRVAASLVTFAEHLALTRPRPSIATLHRLVAAEADRTHHPAPSYATVRRIVAALDPAMVTLALEGPASYRDRHELVLRRRADRPNAIWQADHTQLDILTIGAQTAKPDRPWLTVILDDYSRAICGYTVFLGAPSAMNTALALRQAIWRKPDPTWVMCGIPDTLHVDHGSGQRLGHHAAFPAWSACAFARDDMGPADSDHSHCGSPFPSHTHASARSPFGSTSVKIWHASRSRSQDGSSHETGLAIAPRVGSAQPRASVR